MNLVIFERCRIGANLMRFFINEQLIERTKGLLTSKMHNKIPQKYTTRHSGKCVKFSIIDIKCVNVYNRKYK